MKNIVIVLCLASLFLTFGCNKSKIKFVKDIIVNDTLRSEGHMKGILKYGYWRYYNFEGNLLVVNEYKIINNEAYLNQEIVFDKNGDTLFNKSNFFTCKFRDINNDSVLLEIKYEGIFDAIYDNSKSYPMLVYNNHINADFSNLNEIKLDTLIFKDNQLKISIPKNKELRGVINEVIFLEEGMDIREVYFDYNEDYQDISEIR